MIKWLRDFDLKVGSVGFGICAIPAAWEAISVGSVTMSWSFLWLWFIGEVGSMSWAARKRHWTLFLNYIPNWLALLILMWYNKG